MTIGPAFFFFSTRAQPKCFYYPVLETGGWKKNSGYHQPPSHFQYSTTILNMIRDATWVLKKILKCERRERSDRSLAPCGRGSRGPLKGPWWGPGARPRWGWRGRSPPKPEGFCTSRDTGKAISGGKFTLLISKN